MQHAFHRHLKSAAGIAAAGLLAWPAISAAQDVTGHARAVQATVLGATSVLADTGTLGGVDDARGASLPAGGISSLGTADTMHAATISSIYGWDSSDSVASEASLGNLDLGIAGNTINADFIMAWVLAPVSGSDVAVTSIDGLTVNGSPVDVTGAVNQTVSLLGGRMVINEQQTTASGETVVNAVHVIVDGVADVVLASAAAGVNGPSSSTGSNSGSIVDDLTSTVTNTTTSVLGGL